MLSDLKWQPLQERRKEARLTMFYKIVNDKVAIDTTNRLTPNKTTRTSRHSHDQTYKVPYCRTLYRQKSYFPRTTKEWNSLPPDIVSAATVESFRARLSKQIA